MRYEDGESCAIAVMMAGVSVTVSLLIEKTGMRIFALISLNPSGAPAFTSILTVSKGTPVSWRRM